MESIQQRLESWIKDQSSKILKVSWGPLQWRMKWPWNQNDRKKIFLQEEYERRKKQLHDLCHDLKAESVSDLQDILCAMVLSECVYKRPATEVIRFVNKYKADFGGQVVCIERVQPSSDHVPHRYLLAEAGDTLFASFIGTKQYKDIIADANILQGAIFHEDPMEDSEVGDESEQVESQKRNPENILRPIETNSKQMKNKPKPAAHRGFMARAKGIPALELYKLAQKKKQKLVLCGHSLGGAVAALATLAILRVIAASSTSKVNDNFQVKCITFSQPPVGNAALRDYVNRKGWQHYFKTYCIPEDLIPRILSPAYFHHYNAQPSVLGPETRTTSSMMLKDEGGEKSRADKPKEGEQLVLGLGPVQTSFWRLARLVPLEGIRTTFTKYRGKQVNPVERPSVADSEEASSIEDVVALPQSLEIQEDSDSISLKPLESTDGAINGDSVGKRNGNNGVPGSWRRVPYLPSYVPFGELYLLGSSSVEYLSSSEYSKLTSVRSVIAELRERLQSHSMKSYRSRFQRIYDLCTANNASYFLGLDQLQQFPHLHQLLGLSVADSVELGHIVESPVIRTATSIVPLGWNGAPGDKNAEPLKVDITGFGLHLCTVVQAQVNGKWCSTTIESFPSEIAQSATQEVASELQKMRVLVGAPLKRQPKHDIVTDNVMPIFSPLDTGSVKLNLDHDSRGSQEETFVRPESLNDFVVFCTNDFTTVSKKVHIRMGRVRLLGLEGAGKTCLLKAILSQGRVTASESKSMTPEVDVHEGISGGLCYSDSAGVNLQDISIEALNFRDELWMGIRDLSRKTDLIVLVHNLSHNIPRYSKSSGSHQQPVLSVLLDEAKALGIPWILAITNKFSVSANQQKEAIDAALKAYKASPYAAEIINSCPYMMPSAGSITLSSLTMDDDSNRKMSPQNLISAPLNFVRRPFLRTSGFLPVEGVSNLRQNIHRVLRSHDEACLQEFARDRLLLELAHERALAADAARDSEAKANSLTAAAVGASLGAGIGVVLAVIMGAASALRKP